MQIKNLTKEAFDKYLLEYPDISYYQSASYGSLMRKFRMKERYLAFIENNQIKGEILILSQNIFLYYSQGYAPRGIVCDYNDLTTLDSILKALKKYLIQNNFVSFRMDPGILFLKRDKNQKVFFKNTNIKEIFKIIKNYGFEHTGFNKYFENKLPRFEAELDISNDTVTLFKNLSKQVRNKLKKATKYGLIVYKDNKFDLKKVWSLLKNNYQKLPLKWYEHLHKFFGNNCELYYANLDTVKYVENSRLLYEKELEINDYYTSIIQSSGYKGKDMNNILNKKMQSDKILSAYKSYMIEATHLLKEYPNGLIVGATIAINQNNKLYIISEGYNKTYKNLCIPYLIKWKIIEKYAQTNIKFINFGGISGEKDKKKNKYLGLNQSKLGFNATELEYIGEFNIILNKKVLNFYHKFIKK